MSDAPRGEGWWQASDDQWYPPEQRSDYRPPPPPTPRSEEADGLVAPTTPPTTPPPTPPAPTTPPVMPATTQSTNNPAGRTATAEGVAESNGTGRSPRKKWMFAGIAAAVVLAVGAAGVAVLLVAGGAQSADDRYLEALQQAGADEWSTDRAAVNAGYTVCEGLDAGAPARGSDTDLIAVEVLCDDYLDDFRVLEDLTVTGTFGVYDDDWSPSDEGDRCSPDGGFGDINSSTRVVVRTTGDVELTRSTLGSGVVDALGGCTYTFDLDLTEGEDLFILEVGDRGEISYTWEDLQEDGAIAVSLGDPFDF